MAETTHRSVQLDADPPDETPAFDDIPSERVFAEIKLYLDGDDRPMGQLQYLGDNLKALDVDKAIAEECRLVTELLGKQAQRAIDRAGSVFSVLQVLKDIFDDGEDEKDDDNSDQSSDTATARG